MSCILAGSRRWNAREDVGEGAVFVITLQDQGGFLVPKGSEVWRQSDMDATPQPGDRFGSMLSQVRAIPRRPWSIATQSWAFGASPLLAATEASCSTAVLAHPPQITIQMPVIVGCGSDVQLDAAVSDRDGDHLPPRWIVDGVLLAPEVTTIRVDTLHEIEAVVRDARGSTTTATHTILCW